jgi:glutamate/tyrosine decarboxylase-like PLP-dependent enzyme
MDGELVHEQESLDPDDWDALRALGHRMLDDMMVYLEGVREREVWQPMPDEIRRQFSGPLPQEESPAEEVYDDFKRNVLPYPMGNIHPRFWGWVMGGNTPVAVLADMLASGLNPNMGGGDHAGTRVEAQVIEWCKEMLDFPREGSGLLLSGGSMANFIGLAVARHVGAGYDIREEGVAASPRQMTMYGSVEMHSSLQRAVELLGLGNRYLRKIPVNQDFEIDVAALRQAIEADVAAGLKPVCLIGCAGTVNTGAIDNLDELADIAAEFGMWYHVDGAFGALAYLSPEAKPLLKGMERADSLSFDLHKWVYLPFEVGCTLVRDAEAHYRTFTLTPDYLEHGERGLAAGDRWFSDYGVQLTRGFRALKVWMALKTYGVQKMGRVISKNIGQARYLAQLVEETPELELLAPVPLNVVCYRYTVPGMSEQSLDALNKELLLRLQESGVAVPSGTLVRGRYALRCAITNHRSTYEDIDILVTNTVQLGRALAAETALAAH